MDASTGATPVFNYKDSELGATQWVAQQIAEAIGEELLYIPDLIREGRYTFTLQKEERIGFCFPTHGWQPPRIVREYIRQMKVEGGEYCWALTTCGDNMGECMTILNKELRAIGLEAETVFAVIMPESYVCLPFMHTDPKDKEIWKIENAKHQLSHIIPIIRDRKRGIEELEKGATPRLYSYVIGGYFNKHMITDCKFMVDESVCIRCGKSRSRHQLRQDHEKPRAVCQRGLQAIVSDIKDCIDNYFLGKKQNN